MKELIRKILREQTEEHNILCLPYVGADTDPITGDVGDSRGGGSRTHNGIDITVYSGTELIAPADGIIEIANWRESGGDCGAKIVINHTGTFISPYTGKEVKLRTGYCHLSEVSVKERQTVTKGQKIGKTGGAASKRDGSRDQKNAQGEIVDADNAARVSPDYYREAGAGNSTGKHLHYVVYEDGKYVSPKIYVRGGGKYDYVPCKALATDIVVDDSEELEYVDDSTDYLVDLLKKKRKDEPVEPVTITHNTCDDNNTEEVKEDFIILMKLKKLGYLEPVSSINSCITYEENVTAIKLYQEENDLPIGITGDCRIPIKTRQHVTNNDIEFVKS